MRFIILVKLCAKYFRDDALCGTEYDPGKEPASSLLPRPRGAITGRRHLVQDIVVSRSFVGSNGLTRIRDVKTLNLRRKQTFPRPE